MPARSKGQYKMIQALRSKYGSESKAPEKYKWVFKKDWTDGVDYDSLPENNKLKKYKSIFENK